MLTNIKAGLDLIPYEVVREMEGNYKSRLEDIITHLELIQYEYDNLEKQTRELKGAKEIKKQMDYYIFNLRYEMNRSLRTIHNAINELQ